MANMSALNTAARCTCWMPDKDRDNSAGRSLCYAHVLSTIRRWYRSGGPYPRAAIATGTEPGQRENAPLPDERWSALAGFRNRTQSSKAAKKMRRCAYRNQARTMAPTMAGRRPDYCSFVCCYRKLPSPSSRPPARGGRLMRAYRARAYYVVEFITRRTQRTRSERLHPRAGGTVLNGLTVWRWDSSPERAAYDSEAR
jgi:hypothetical protein